MAPNRDDHSAGQTPSGTAAAPLPAPPPEPARPVADGGATRVERPERQPGYGSKAPAFIRRSRSLHLAWRIGIMVVGCAVIAGGVLLLPLPGPGWAIIFAGLAILATEFAWAQRLLHWTRAKLTEYARRAVDPGVRQRNLAILAGLLVLLAVGVALYVWQWGWTLPW
ncbi:TIGR02611 family protein [Streptomyces sp. NPDC092296]|uniref:TIGR02611 family protein n=1 Tax=Streptomyces sp. NPDC092296 TaxID=3366012 RepID=UPI00380EC8CB